MPSTASTILSKASRMIQSLARPSGEIGMKDENNPGTPEYEQKYEELEEGQDVLALWQEMESVYHYVFTRLSENREFYLGEKNEQWAKGVTVDGDIQLIFNLGATVIDLFTYILSNNPPYVQCIADDTKPMSQLRANFTEEFISKMLYDAKFKIRFRDGVKTQFMMGFCWPFWVWNTDNKDGGEKGTLEMTILNAFYTRVKYASNDYEKIEAFITVKRLSKDEIKRKYDFDALPDTEDTYIPKEITIIDDGKSSVFNYYDDKGMKTVVNGRVVSRKIHDYGFVPIRQVNNIFVPNDAHGHSDIERWKPIAQELNALLSAASEIARDLAYPPILEYNNALGGRKIPKWRGQKIPVRRSDKGEAVAFMSNPAQIVPLINQAKLLLDLFHFVSLMPKAAAGIFDASITSGFQAKLAMQPATLTSENRKIDWETAILDMLRMGIKILEKETPETFRLTLDDGTAVEMTGLYNQRMEVIWPDNLPIDIAREIQNLVLGIQNNLTSVHQAIDKYNVLMGLGSPTDTEEYLAKESEMIELNPDRALKIAKVREAMMNLDNLMQQADAKLSQLRGQMNAGAPRLPPNLQTQNPTNLARGAASPLPEEQRVTSETAEAVPLESTGGVLPQGGRV